MNNEKLAQFITSLGRFNNYGSTVAQTKEALDKSSLSFLRDDQDDRVIFEDSLKAIRSLEGRPFGAASIILINSQFTGQSKEQPNNPGKLRDSVHDPIRDHIHIDLWLGEEGRVIQYFPPAQIDEDDIEIIVRDWSRSQKTDKKAWEMFAKLAKLQPFQDGNKRTALISVNHALGALDNQYYLMPPIGRQYNRFMDALLGYYGVGLEGGPESEEVAMIDFLSVAPDRG